jgi:protein-L-isoaspartate(D-aspartate) O-methyltransferase
MNTKEQLIEHLEKNTKVLQTPKIKEAFEKVDRIDFVPEHYKEEAYEDYPLPLGFGQTISQPTTVSFMIELLNLKPNSKVLDVGSGSGYTTALMATIVSKGDILGLEIIPELAENGKTNIAKYNFPNAKIECFDGKLILSMDSQKFDRILVNAAAKEIPENLLGVLKPEGIMVIPIRQSIFKITKNKSGKIDLAEYPGFAFVPLK